MTGEGIWEGLTTLIEIFERTDPARTGNSAPSTNADSTLNKEGSDRGVGEAAAISETSENKKIQSTNNKDDNSKVGKN